MTFWQHGSKKRVSTWGSPSRRGMGDVPENDAPYPTPARTSPNLLQRRGTFETMTNVFAGAEQTLGGGEGWASCFFFVL